MTPPKPKGREKPAGLHVLSVASEVFPFIKTGGLADVTGSLPLALAEHGVSTRTLMPGYPEVLRTLGAGEPVLRFDHLFGGRAQVLALRQQGIDLLVLDAPHLFERPGGPYQRTDGSDHPDNWARFAALGKAGAAIAEGAVADFRPDIVHAHDWQAALAPVYLSFANKPRARTVMTIHNLAFQGRFPASIFPDLGLPDSAWSMEGVEYYGGVGFLKGGLHAADRVTTVSPTYADEIRTPEGGMGLDGLLRGRGDHLVGIVNGIDTGHWNPETDAAIAARYAQNDMEKRAVNKAALEREFRLEPGDGPIFAVVSRLTWQKGMDMLAGLCEAMETRGARLVVVGSGDSAIEGALLACQARHPGHVGVRIGYDEALSHRVQAGADALLVPSRFEPCGLTQLFALRYGCIPVVSRVGGLADTVIDANFAAVGAGVATGVIFSPASREELVRAIDRVVHLYENAEIWRTMQARGMNADNSWRTSARRYADLYRDLLK